MSLNKIEIFDRENSPKKFISLRRDIVDRNGALISRNIKSFHAAINLKLSNKKNLIIKLRINFPNLPISIIEQKINEGKYFFKKKNYSR